MDHDAVIEVRRFTYQKSRSSSTLDFGVPNSQRRLAGKLSSRGSLVSSSFFFVSSRYFDDTCSHIISKVVCRICEGRWQGSAYMHAVRLNSLQLILNISCNIGHGETSLAGCIEAALHRFSCRACRDDVQEGSSSRFQIWRQIIGLA